MALEMVGGCQHTASDMDVAANADGLCPICLAERNARLKDVVDWVETWVSNPVGAYSTSALDGLFAMTRNKIDALRAC